MPDALGLGAGLTRRQLYEQTVSQLYLERASFEASWRELASYWAPRRIRTSITDTNRGDRRTQLIYDSTPQFALRTLQSGLHAGITSPARPWFKLTVPDQDLAEQADVKAWTYTVSDRMRTVFLRSNLYNSLPILYGDIGCFATGAMAVLEDEKDLIRTYTYPLMSYAFGLDSRGVATTFVREYRRTARQLIQEFGGPDGQPLERGQDIHWENFSQECKDAWQNGHPERMFDVCWFVCPNDEYNPRALSAKYSLPWKSCWFEKSRDWKALGGTETYLRESGYRTFPFMCPRWDVVGEDTYGTDGPGWVALGDVKQLQFMAKKTALAIDKSIDPPLKAPNALRNQKVSMLPGDLTYVDERDAGKSLSPVHEVRLEGLQFLLQDRAETRMRVNEATYASLFLMLASSDYLQAGGQPVTAREIEERHEEKLLALGPVLERLNDELLDPLIDRVFDIMLNAGAIPPPPEALEGVDLKVEYTSIMAQAQKLVGIAGADRFISTITMTAAALVPVNPTAASELTKKVAWMQTVDDYGDALSPNPNWVRSDEDVQAEIEQEAQAAAAVQAAESMKTAAQGINQLGNTPGIEQLVPGVAA